MALGRLIVATPIQAIFRARFSTGFEVDSSIETLAERAKFQTRRTEPALQLQAGTCQMGPKAPKPELASGQTPNQFRLPQRPD